MKRALFDHCTPWPLHRHLAGWACHTCYERGWDTLRNGELLAAAEHAGYFVLITADQNMRYQQDLRGRRLAIIELPTNHLATVLALGPAVVAAIETIAPGGYVQIPLR